MNKVSNISRLGQYVKSFQGATVDEAIRYAEFWAQKHNYQLAGNVYLQVRLGKSESIIVDIQPIKESENE